MKPEVFHILLALCDRELHGYAIIREVAERTDGEIRLQAGALYRELKRLLDDGTIEELDRRKVDAGGDTRRRFYRITRQGRALASAEARRMARLVEAARARKLLPASAR